MKTKTKIIQLQRNTEGQVVNMREQLIDHEAFTPQPGEYEPLRMLTESVIEVGGRKRTVRIPLREAFLVNPDAANILRDDLRYLAFSTFKEMPRSFEGFTNTEPSMKPQEEYLRDAAIGVLPRVPSGTAAPDLISDFEGGTTIVNNRHAGIVKVLGDWIRFDEIGKIRQVGMEMGRAGRMTEEYEVYRYITNTANYTRNSTTRDNDVGANTQTLTFDADGLDQALTIISTAKDRKSGSYLGYNADTLICGPRMELPVKQLLMGTDLMRSHGATTAETRGLGTVNVFQGIINSIIVSPWFGASYQWAITDGAANAFKYQLVEPFNVFEEAGQVTNEMWLTHDVIRWLAQGYFGVGFTDDRAWFYSDSTTAPTVA